ncbi:unnamed protein product [Periconia digitata]|uniref:Uncharacterized protein n=1 Tax=Periconia digitata TaxID=1303443 RepID=A0A9W4UGS1_9PLEO|nr:unnamed protein product [Periconia digitata]
MATSNAGLTRERCSSIRHTQIAVMRVALDDSTVIGTSLMSGDRGTTILPYRLLRQIRNTELVLGLLATYRGSYSSQLALRHSLVYRWLDIS